MGSADSPHLTDHLFLLISVSQFQLFPFAVSEGFPETSFDFQYGNMALNLWKELSREHNL